MTGIVMKSGLILYYNICQSQSDINNDYWQKCVVDVTDKKFLAWHTITKENGDILQGSVQLGSEYEILSYDYCEISSDIPTVPKEYKLSQMFGIKKKSFKFTYWFIDITEEQEWITLLQSYVKENLSRSSSPVLDDCTDKLIDSSKQMKTDSHINENECIVYKKCQFPIIEQPKAHIGTSSNDDPSFKAPAPVAIAMEVVTDHTCCEMCFDLFCYPFLLIHSCTKIHGPSYHTSHVPNDDCCGNCDCCCCCGSCEPGCCDCACCSDCDCGSCDADCC
ncbi:uncharacterized protein LOC111640489 isoform X1 [Centruroides sculpturatus]|uniref:uncharacterized protein LOC111640489 isoform X1 n=1 Tax=Centruroides sculpturatus TaxID=218467 RepID=UPI000C6E16A5|nr:uncharacterized protein LOC111640489 isoform X1 [Centruroides sculpturatus]